MRKSTYRHQLRDRIDIDLFAAETREDEGEK
jgi:hypothetical protein